MPIVDDKGVYYEDEVEYQVSQLPADIRRVYITSKQAPEDTEKPAGEFKIEEVVYPTPDYVNPPEGSGNIVKGVGKFIEKTAKNIATLPQRAIENSQESLNTGNYDPSVPVEVAMTSITGSLPFSKTGTLGAGGGNINDAYINMFIKQPKIEPKDEFEKAYKAIVEALDGPGAYEKELAKTAEKKTIPITESGKTGFEQIPFGHTKESWSSLSSLQKDAFLKNPSNTPGTPEQIPFETPPEPFSAQNIFKEGASEKWPLTAKESAEIYSNYIAAGKNSEANTFYGNFMEASKGPEYSKKIKELESEIYKLEDLQLKKIQAKDDLAVKAAKAEAESSALSKYDKLINTVEKVQGKLFNAMLHERAKYFYERAKQTVPEKALEAGYDTPAFRGIRVYGGGEPNPKHNFNKSFHMYSSDSPLLADMYASYLASHPGWKVRENAFAEGASVVPLVINTKNYYIFDAGGETWQNANHIAIARARAENKPGVIVKNVYDEPNSTKALGKPATVYITFPSGASTVKSRHAAKFDPSSPNMLHMIPVIAVGGAAGYVSKEPSDGM